METLLIERTARGDAEPELEELQTEARRLWNTELPVEPALRTALLHELTDVRLELELLSLRVSQTQPGVADHILLEECRDRLAALRCHWPPTA